MVSAVGIVRCRFAAPAVVTYRPPTGIDRKIQECCGLWGQAAHYREHGGRTFSLLSLSAVVWNTAL